MKGDVEREIICQECGEVNSVKIPEFPGTFTKFCKGCGTQLRLYIGTTLLELESTKTEES